MTSGGLLMVDPDAAESGAAAAVHVVSEAVSALWFAAHYDGVRQGLELAAQMAEATAKAVRDNYDSPAEVRAVGPVCLNELRDSLRLAALQIGDPAPHG